MKKIIFLFAIFLTISPAYTAENYMDSNDNLDEIKLIAEPQKIIDLNNTLSKKEVKAIQKAEKEKAELDKKIQKALEKAEENLKSLQDKNINEKTEIEVMSGQSNKPKLSKKEKKHLEEEMKKLQQEEEKLKIEEEKINEEIKKYKEGLEKKKEDLKNKKNLIKQEVSDTDINKNEFNAVQTTKIIQYNNTDVNSNNDKEPPTQTENTPQKTNNDFVYNKKESSLYKKQLKNTGIKFNNENFIKQAEINNTENVSKFLYAGMKPDVCNESKTTPLIWASFNGNLEMVKMLISAGANVNAVNKDGFTPLHAAVENENIEIVKYLLAKGAKINSSTISDKTTPLHTACFKGNKEIVQLLTVAGADVNAKNIHGATPVVTASFYGKKDIVQYLNTNGSKFNMNSEDGKILTVAAILEGKTSSFEALLLSGVDINTKDKNGKTMLISAVENSDEDAVKMLLEKGADVSVTYDNDTNKQIPILNTAVIQQNEDIIKLLVKNGADINAKEAETSISPLTLAVLTGNEDIIFNGITPADIALAKKDENMLKKLVQKGALFGKKTGVLLVPYGCSISYNLTEEKYSINPEDALEALKKFENDEHKDYNSYMKNTLSFRNDRGFVPDKHAFKVYPLLFELME